MSFFFSREDPYREVDWRWQWGRELVAAGLKLTRSTGDRYVSPARRFVIALGAPPWWPLDYRREYALRSQFPELFRAWVLFQSGRHQNLRIELQARLLAGEPIESLTAKIGYAPEVIETFAATFFDVADRLGQAALIENLLFASVNSQSSLDHRRQAAWQMIGYRLGYQMLDYLLHDGTARNRSSSESMEATAAAAIRRRLVAQLLLDVYSRQSDSSASTDIGDALQRLEKLHRQFLDGQLANNDMLDALQALLENLPWTRSAALAHKRNLVFELEKNGVGLRADEMMLVVSGQTPSGLAELLQSAKYPPRIKTTTVSS